MGEPGMNMVHNYRCLTSHSRASTTANRTNHNLVSPASFSPNTNKPLAPQRLRQLAKKGRARKKKGAEPGGPTHAARIGPVSCFSCTRLIQSRVDYRDSRRYPQPSPAQPYYHIPHPRWFSSHSTFPPKKRPHDARIALPISSFPLSFLS